MRTTNLVAAAVIYKMKSSVVDCCDIVGFDIAADVVCCCLEAKFVVGGLHCIVTTFSAQVELNYCGWLS